MELWLSTLAQGQTPAAWDLFVEQYRRLIVATIKRLVSDHDDVMDVFSHVCEALSANDFARLRRYSDQSARPATVSTWLVAVVRNLTIDWLRARDGRRRISIPATLPALRQAIYTAVCVERRSHVEAYEVIRARTGLAMPFHLFLREVRATHLAAPCPEDTTMQRAGRDAALDDVPAESRDPVETAESVQRVAGALAAQPADVRLAVQLFVVERMTAADVARVVGWPNAKTVYNRVYRALQALRDDLQRAGIGPGDL